MVRVNVEVVKNIEEKRKNQSGSFDHFEFDLIDLMGFLESETTFGLFLDSDVESVTTNSKGKFVVTLSNNTKVEFGGNTVMTIDGSYIKFSAV